MKLSDLVTKQNPSDAEDEINRGMASLIDELGDQEIEPKDANKWLETAQKRWLELVAGEPGDN